MTIQDAQFDAESTAEHTAELSKDDIFELLSNHRRRYALHYLKQQNGDDTVLSDLTEQIAAWENDKTLSQITAPERKRVYNSLQQYHLPKMRTAGIIEYDDRRGHIRLVAKAEALDIYLDIVGEHEIPWSRYYAGVSSLCVVVVASAWAGLYPQSLVSGYAWAVVIAGVFLLSSVAHLYTERRMRIGADGLSLDQRTR